MGMFDWLRCDYPLPGEKLVSVVEFQTKSLDCVLQIERITENGELEGRPDFTGTIDFHGSNVVASGPAGRYTHDGEDAEYVDYLATFVNGKLVDIQQTHYEKEPVLPSSELHLWREERIGSKLEEDDSPLLGKKLFVCHGGIRVDQGYEVEVVYETEREICLKRLDKGTLELEYKSQIGNILFESLEEAKADREHEQEQIKKEKEDYQRKIKEKIERRKNEGR